MVRLLIVAFSIVGPAALAEPRPATLAVLPIGTQGPETGLEILIEWDAIAALAASGRYSVYHPKQVRELLRAEGLGTDAVMTAALAPRLLRGLGAERGVVASLTRTGAGYQLKGVAYGAAGGTQAFAVNLADAGPQSVARGAEALAAAVEALWQQRLPGVPVPSVYRDGLVEPLSWARCLERLNRLPISLDHPGVVLPHELDDLVATCRTAVRSNPAHAPSGSALALALAVAGDDIEAVRLVMLLAPRSDALPLWWLSRFWLAARYVSPQAGLEVLDAAARRHPEHLLFFALRVELLEALDQPGAALEAALSLEARAPGAPQPMMRTARALAALGRHAEAVSRARQAATAFPAGREVRVELAARLIHSGQPDEAAGLLEGLRQQGAASTEAQVRLAQASLRMGKPQQSRRELDRAAATRSSPHQWLSDGRAWYDLAVTAAHLKQPELARAALAASRATGFRPAQLDPWLEPVALGIESDATVVPVASPRVLSPLDLTAPLRGAVPQKPMRNWFQPGEPGFERSPFTSDSPGTP